MPPAARLTDMHTCPMCTGSTPHIGGPILGKGSKNVRIEGKASARVYDAAHCNGSPPALIATGCKSVKVNRRLAARTGDFTSGGGAIISGAGTVNIGKNGDSVAVMAIASPECKDTNAAPEQEQSSSLEEGSQCQDYSKIPYEKSRVAVVLTEDEFAKMEAARSRGGPAEILKTAEEIAKSRDECGFRHTNGEFDPNGEKVGTTGITNGARVRSFDDNGDYAWEYTAVDHYLEYNSLYHQLRSRFGMAGETAAMIGGHIGDALYDTDVGKWLWKKIQGDSTTIGTDGDDRPPSKYDPRVEAAENCGLAGEPLKNCSFDSSQQSVGGIDTRPIDPADIPSGHRESGLGKTGDIAPGARNPGSVTYRPDGRPIYH